MTPIPVFHVTVPASCGPTEFTERVQMHEANGTPCCQHCGDTRFAEGLLTLTLPAIDLDDDEELLYCSWVCVAEDAISTVLATADDVPDRAELSARGWTMKSTPYWLGSPG